MNSPVSSVSYLARAQTLCKKEDKESLFYAALELRCGIEARLREHVAVAKDVPKNRAREWRIAKLAKTVDGSFQLGDSMVIVFLTLADGRTCQFMYSPVSTQLQAIGERCGDYLHAIQPERLESPTFWADFRSLVAEGCGLLNLACSSEILRPSFSDGLHFNLQPDDPRITLLQDLNSGMAGSFQVAKITPTGPITYYPNA